MALTRVSRHIIDEPFNPTTVSATDVTTTNINASGIGTVGTLRVTGDLTVEGTTTTLDSILTEVDRLEVSANSTVAAGIITQTGSGDILNLFDGSTEVFTVTDGGKVGIEAPNPSGNLNISYLQVGKGQVSSDHSLYNYNTSFTNNAYQNGNGTFAHITSRAVGVINLQDNVLTFSNGPGGTAGQSATLTERLRVTSTGDMGLGTNSPNQKLHLHAAGSGGNKIKFTNDTTATGASDGFTVGIDGSENAELRLDEATDMLFVTNSTERLRITSDGKVRVPDNGKITCGASDDLQIYHTGSHSLIDESGTGNLVIRSNLISFEKYTNEQLARFTADGSCEFYYDNSKKLETTTNGIQITGQIDIGTTSIYSTGDISMGDSDQLRLGGGDDLRLYHDATDSFISHSGPGHLYIKTETDDRDVIIQSDNGSGGLANYVKCDGSTGAVELTHLGNIRIQTTNTGASVTGNLNISGHTYLNDNRELVIGAGNDLKLYHNATANYIDNTSDLYVRVNGSETAIYATANGKVALNYDGSNRIETTTTGVEVSGATKTDTLEVTQEYPSIRPILDLNFAATKTLDRRITFTRDSVGTYVGEDGLVKYASNNVPRFDHDPTTGESLGLLIEESRTNYVDNSNDVSQWNRIINNATVESNTTDTLSPDGTNTSTKITGGTNSGISRDDLFSTSASTTYTSSIFC